MAPLDPHEPSTDSRWSGLSRELLTLIHHQKFQETVRLFVPKSDTVFRIFRGIGFALALAAGIFGYYLKADSEADNRRAETIQRIIDQKIEWMRDTTQAAMDLRKERFLITQKCTYDKALTPYEQSVRRDALRVELIKAFSGISQVFNEEVFNAWVDFVAFDKSIVDVCDPAAPSDEIYQEKLRVAARPMRKSIQEDRQKLEELSEGLLNRIFFKL